MCRYSGADSTLTVSGLSAGAFAAVQFHVAYSSSVNGCGVLAGGPFFCAEAMLGYAETRCMKEPQMIDVDQLVSITEDMFLSKSIDNPRNLADDRVWVLSAMEDTVVHTGVVEATASYYENYLTTPLTQLAAIYTKPGEHSFLTNGVGSSCVTLGSPYINDCKYDAAGAILQHLFNNELTRPTSKESDDEGLDDGQLVKFDQTKYITGDYTASSAGMYDYGYMYVPDQCADSDSNCKIHVAFHGCEQTIDDIGDVYVRETGYNRWAAANDIIVLYPQAKKITREQKNPNGCFDWWGYTDSHYATQKGVQMKAVYAMAQDLM